MWILAMAICAFAKRNTSKTGSRVALLTLCALVPAQQREAGLSMVEAFHCPVVLVMALSTIRPKARAMRISMAIGTA